MKGADVPKGRGSNKKGGGPTPPKQQEQEIGGIPPEVENMVLKNQLEEKIFHVRQLQQRAEQLLQMAMAVLDTKRGKSATLSVSRVEKVIDTYGGISSDLDEDAGELTLTLEKKEEADVTTES